MPLGSASWTSGNPIPSSNLRRGFWPRASIFICVAYRQHRTRCEAKEVNDPRQTFNLLTFSARLHSLRICLVARSSASSVLFQLVRCCYRVHHGCMVSTPKCRPIFGKDASASCLAKYMAIWHGTAPRSRRISAQHSSSMWIAPRGSVTPSCCVLVYFRKCPFATRI
jgi:hypothetical protein